MSKTKEKLKFWLFLFVTASLEGGFALVTLLRIPSEGNNAFLLGLSPLRLAMVGVLLLFALLFAWLGWMLWRGAGWLTQWLDANNAPHRFVRLHWLVAIGAFVLSSLLFLLRYYDPATLMPFYQRAKPLGLYLLLLGIQTSFLLFLIRFDVDFQKIKKQYFKEVGIVFTALLAVFIFVAVTRLGIIPDTAYWGEPGVPLLGWQFGLVLSLGILMSAFLWRDQRFPRWGDLAFVVTIWGLAVLIWSSVPMSVLTNSYYAPYAYPLNASVPYSDSGFYDYLSQGLLLGSGFITKIPPRPLYIVFLAGAHALYGFDYQKITFLQILVIAFLPVIFYLIAKKLHSRPAGIIIALFVIFREWTSLMISSQTRVANTRMILTDLPTVLALAVVMLAVIHWLERSNKNILLPFIAGGLSGMLLLLRTQSMLIFPAVIALAFLIYFPRWKEWLVVSAIFVLGIVLVAFPWLIRNAKLTGKITFDDPAQLALLSSQYGTSNVLDTKSFDFENESLSNSILDFALNNPVFVARFISSHFFATEISALLALPLIYPFNGFQEPFNIYWMDWNGSLSPPNVILLLLYLLVISFGISAAWKRLRWIGLVPLFFSLVYALSNGVARFSGWRYSLPADWVGYFYFGLGFVEMLLILARLLGIEQRKRFPSANTPLFSKPYLPFLGLAIIFVFVGALPVIVENNIPPKFPLRTGEELLAEITPLNTEISSFSTQTEAVILEGDLIWPRYYSANDGLTSSNPWPVYVGRDYPRTGFIILNDRRTDVVFPRKGPLPVLESGLDVIVLGCQCEDHLEARFVYLIDSGEMLLSDREFTPCLQ